ncbi:putative receptor-like protein kinase At5g39000 isoform X1 [Lactuca sativa]|uniref:putative receptor-like protein kinase At5g39000 isoform X1 n=1 Tax=Lactuca sativa TaxID=4236 RepID=UPI000CD85CAE|nr:putative receptor-like protein kinase At5g39000 isoform X1 [Lactuca sativa]
MLSVYKHQNIVSLLGFCDEKDQKILVYEYASNRSLDLHLDNKDLMWVRRLKVCLGVARGLAYLHDPGETQQRVLHHDIKSSNILLDENWNAKIVDLGLSRFCPANQKYTFIVTNNTVGTVGYCDPLYLESGILTKESDVYSFGVVLFEVLCGRLCFVNNGSFTQLVRKHYRQNNLNEFVWGNIRDEIHPSSFKAFSTIAYQCLKSDNEKRPLMSDIVRGLETALQYQLSTALMSMQTSHPSFEKLQPEKVDLLEQVRRHDQYISGWKLMEWVRRPWFEIHPTILEET